MKLCGSRFASAPLDAFACCDPAGFHALVQIDRATAGSFHVTWHGITSRETVRPELQDDENMTMELWRPAFRGHLQVLQLLKGRLQVEGHVDDKTPLHHRERVEVLGLQIT